MKASETSLRNLLEGTKQFQIPLFQRSYSWKKENWQMLWDDLMMIYKEEENNDPFFMGSIVTQATSGTADGISPFIVIDGQQRLTTLTILLASIRNSLEYDSALKAEIYDMHLINKYKQNDNYYKLLPTQSDRDCYMKIIDLKNINTISNDEKILEVFNFFNKHLKKIGKEEQYFRILKNIILERLFFVNITSEKEDNPYLIFESLNYKGQDLTQSDLVINYIFMQLDSDKREEVYRQTWLSVQEEFLNKFENNQEKVAEELTNPLWFYLRKDGKSILQRDIYKAFQYSFKKDDQDSVELELKKVIKFLRYYLKLSFSELDLPEVSPFLKRFKILDFKVVYVFLLNVYDDYENQKISKDELILIFKYLESYFVRRWIVDISTRSLPSVFNKLYSQVEQSDGETFVMRLYKVLNNFPDNSRWPKNEEFIKSIRERAIYKKKNTERIKLFLLSLERFLTKEKIPEKNLTIEHIMPQTITQEWQRMLGTQKGQQNKYLHRLGNLTLTAYNPELSNKEFSKKREYFDSSNVSLNQYFRQNNITKWDLDAIDKRSEYIADLAIQVWIR